MGCLLAVGLWRCGEAPPPVAPTAPIEVIAADTLRMQDFSYAQRQAWDAATEAWYAEEYFGHCLQENGFVLNCTDCTNLGVMLALTVDAEGKIAKSEALEAKIYCHDHTEKEEADVEACLLNSFPKLRMPAPFFERVLVVFVGRVPSC